MLSSWPALFLTRLVLAFVVGGIYRAWLLQSTGAFVVFVEAVKPREEWRKLSQTDSSRLAAAPLPKASTLSDLASYAGHTCIVMGKSPDLTQSQPPSR